MKKIFTFLLLSFFVATVLFANPVEPEKALEVAKTFWKSQSDDKAVELVPCSSSEMSKVASRFNIKENDPQFYLFTPENSGGFVIVSGEDELPAIVGYSTDATNYAADMPDALVAWLGEYSEYVDNIRSGAVEPAKVQVAKGTRVEPMLKTTWDQGAPYNNMCPTINGQLPPTGCTATAMAQILKFHEWPKSPKKNVSWNNNITGVVENVNITSHVYDWANMLGSYNSGYTTTQANAVAQLMVDVGKAIGSHYALSGTGSSEYAVGEAIVNVFDYSPEVTVVRRSETTEEAFVSLIRKNLEARQPLLFSGQSQNFESGHAFVCDGIDENNLLHIDWGWSGSYNGYFSMTYMKPSGIGTGGGAGRYNVAQAVVANIRPRTSGESYRSGDPTLYLTEIFNPNDVTKTPIKEYVVNNVTGNIDFKIATYFLNWSHSTVTSSVAVAIEEENGKYAVHEISGATLSIPYNNAVGYYLTFSVNITDRPKGRYNIKICYKKSDGSFSFMPGDNKLIMEIGDTQTKLYKATPDVGLASFDFQITPMYKGDLLSFTANFINRNKFNSTVIIVPVLNKQQADGTYKRTILTNYAAMVDVYDDREIYAEFETYEKLNEECNYFVSFMYNAKNYYTDRKVEVDTNSLIDVEGQSLVFAITAIPDGAVPSVSAFTADNVTEGKKLSIKATIKNISSTETAYSGTLGIFVKSVATGKSYLMDTYEVTNLAKGSTKMLTYSNAGYVPMFVPGEYIPYVCELKDDWVQIKHSVVMPRFNIEKQQAAMLYAASRININEGKAVAQGSTFETKLKVAAINADFDGYVRVSVSAGINTVVKSEYIPVSIKAGDVVDITIPCECTAKATLGDYDMTIAYYNSNKTRIGILSNNVLIYPGNGYFWVADATAIDVVDESVVSVSAVPGAIVVNNASENSVYTTVYSVGGAVVYNGCNTYIPVAQGLYIVSVKSADGKVVHSKVYVRK